MVILDLNSFIAGRSGGLAARRSPRTASRGAGTTARSLLHKIMQRRISPARAISAAITLPGDKSISHRYALIAAIAEGPTRIRNYSTGADCHSTLGCVRGVGDRGGGGGARGHDSRPRPRRPARAGGRSGRGQFGLDHPHALRHSGGAAVSQPDFRRRLAFAAADAADHEAARADGRAHPGAGGTVSAARNRGRAAAAPSTTPCRWRARR